MAADEFTQSLQLVAVFHMGYCSNDYTINGKNNLCLRSEELDDSIWTKESGISILANDPATEGPHDGDGNIADKVTSTTLNASVRQSSIDVGPTVLDGRTFTASFWVKRIPLTGPTGETSHIMRIQLNEFGQTNGRTSDMEIKDQDGWRRLVFPVTISTQVTAPTLNLKIVPASAANPAGTYSIWVSKVQLVEDPLALRYAKTLGTGTEAECSTCTVSDLGDKKRCYYSFQTCQDLIHFDGIDDAGRSVTSNVRRWAFSLKRGYDLQEKQMGGSVTKVRPYILDTNYMSQKIDPRRAVTQSTRITLKMSDDFNPGKFDDGKTLENTSGAGSFWRMWERRYRNFVHRKVELWIVPAHTGVLEDIATSYRPFIGLIDDMQFNIDGTINVVLKDILKKTRDRVPNAISDDNILLLGIGTGDTQLKIGGNLLEFTDPATLKALSGATATKVGIRIGDIGTEEGQNEEISTLTSIDQVAGTITVVREQYGTTAVVHAAGEQVTEIIVYRDVATGLVGFNPVDVMYDLLTRAGIDSDFFNEDSFIDERDMWLAGKTMSRIVEEPEDVEKLLREIRQLMFAAIWTNEEQKIQFKLLAPSSLVISGPLNKISDEANLISRSVSVNVDDRSRINRVILFYDPVDYRAGTSDKKSYRQQIYVEDISATDPRNYGKTAPPLRIYTKWFRAAEREHAEFFAKKMVSIYKNGLPIYTFDLNFKDRLNKVGGYVLVESRDHVDVNGDPQISELFITEKKRKSKTLFSYSAVSMRDKPKYALIAPANTPDYTDPASTEEERRKYAYIGNKQNKLDDGKVEGVRSW